MSLLWRNQAAGGFNGRVTYANLQLCSFKDTRRPCRSGHCGRDHCRGVEHAHPGKIADFSERAGVRPPAPRESALRLNSKTHSLPSLHALEHAHAACFPTPAGAVCSRLRRLRLPRLPAACCSLCRDVPRGCSSSRRRCAAHVLALVVHWPQVPPCARPHPCASRAPDHHL